MAGKIEIRASGEKFRFVVLNRSGDKLIQSGQFDDKPGAKRAAAALGRAVSGAEIVDTTKPAAAPAVKTTPEATAAEKTPPEKTAGRKPAAKPSAAARSGAGRAARR